MDYEYKIGLEIYNSFLEMAYEIYKLDWLLSRGYKTEQELENSREMYVCYNEFLDNEFVEYRNEYCDIAREFIEGFKK